MTKLIKELKLWRAYRALEIARRGFKQKGRAFETTTAYQGVRMRIKRCIRRLAPFGSIIP
jgi:hypothetical protein